MIDQRYRSHRSSLSHSVSGSVSLRQSSHSQTRSSLEEVSEVLLSNINLASVHVGQQQLQMIGVNILTIENDN